IRNGRSASLQRTFKKSFTSFSHSTRNKTRDGLIRVRNIRALNGRFNTSITHAYSIVIGSKHITLNATLPTGSVDPNFGRRVRNRRQLNSLQNTWPYGYSMPIAVRYTQDAFSRSGWLWPVDAKGEPLKATSYMAVGFYVAKY